MDAAQGRAAPPQEGGQALSSEDPNIEQVSTIMNQLFPEWVLVYGRPSNPDDDGRSYIVGGHAYAYDAHASCTLAGALGLLRVGEDMLLNPATQEEEDDDEGG